MKRACVLVLAIAALVFPRPGVVSPAAQIRHLNPLIAKLASGGAAVSGQDWQFIDLEHNPLDLTKLDGQIEEIMAAKSADGRIALKMAPIVRIPQDGDENFKWVVKQVLEIGAMGVVFPRVETKAQAELAVRTHRFKPLAGARYPNPAGLRHVTPNKAARRWGLSIDDYIYKYADVWPLNPDGELFAMIMIESQEGVKNLEEILSVPGIGAIFIGPNDLSMSYGIGRRNRNPEAAEKPIQTILAACKAHQVICGLATEGGGPQAVQERIKQGFRVILD